MSDDLVEQARSFCIHTPLSKPMITKLADRIEKLEAERDAALNQMDSAHHSVEVLEAQVARLREALDKEKGII